MWEVLVLVLVWHMGKIEKQKSAWTNFSNNQT
jgi:hypothetical protein